MTTRSYLPNLEVALSTVRDCPNDAARKQRQKRVDDLIPLVQEEADRLAERIPAGEFWLKKHRTGTLETPEAEQTPEWQERSARVQGWIERHTELLVALREAREGPLNLPKLPKLIPVKEMGAHPGCLFIGRGNGKTGEKRLRESVWMNPYTVACHGREGAMQKYWAHLSLTPDLMKRLPELRGKTLATDEPHGEVIVSLLRMYSDEQLANWPEMGDWEVMDE